MAKWRGLLITTQGQDRNQILDPSPTAKSRTQSRVVTGLHTGHSTLRRHRYIMWMVDSPLCRCGAEKETSDHVLCECEALASLRHACLGSFFLDPEDVRSLSLSTVCNFVQKQNSHDLDIRLWVTNGLSKSLHASGPKWLERTYYSILYTESVPSETKTRGQQTQLLYIVCLYHSYINQKNFRGF